MKMSSSFILFIKFLHPQSSAERDFLHKTYPSITSCNWSYFPLYYHDIFVYISYDGALDLDNDVFDGLRQLDA
jgi:hypothetical protein